MATVCFPISSARISNYKTWPGERLDVKNRLHTQSRSLKCPETQRGKDLKLSQGWRMNQNTAKKSKRRKTHPTPLRVADWSMWRRKFQAAHVQTQYFLHNSFFSVCRRLCRTVAFAIPCSNLVLLRSLESSILSSTFQIFLFVWI